MIAPRSIAIMKHKNCTFSKNQIVMFFVNYFVICNYLIEVINLIKLISGRPIHGADRDDLRAELNGVEAIISQLEEKREKMRELNGKADHLVRFILIDLGGPEKSDCETVLK